MPDDKIICDYFDIHTFCNEVNPLIKPESIDREKLYSLWNDGEVLLCFDWGDSYWPNVLIDLEAIVSTVKFSQQYHSVPSKLVNVIYSILNEPIDYFDNNTHNKLINRIEKIITSIKERKSNLVLPEYDSFISSQEHKYAPFGENGDFRLINPLFRFMAKPYGCNCESFFINIPVDDEKKWISYEGLSLHPSSVKVTTNFNMYYLNGFDFEDFIVPAEEINSLINLYIKSENERKLVASNFKDIDACHSSHEQNKNAPIKTTEIEKRSSIYAQVEQVNNNNTSASIKTINYLAVALKSLIHIEYGADVAENIRKNLEDPYSEISQDFIKHGIKAPGGKALQNHLRDIVIEILPELEKVEVPHSR